MHDMRSRWRNSIGSSIVITFLACSRFTASTKAASVVDLPTPVGPVTSTRPRGWNACSRTDTGSPRASKGGISTGMARKAMASGPRCTKTFARRRRPPRNPERELALPVRLEFFLLAFGEDASDPALDVLLGRSAVAVDPEETAVYADQGLRADLDVQVGASRLEHQFEQDSEIHRAS